jgi:IclR family KDG regulon transcriptional repressor
LDPPQVEIHKDTPIMNYSVAKAFAILEYLASTGGARELGVISRALGMHKSTTYRFLSTLAALGYVAQDPETSRYALGSRVVWLASTYLDSLDLRTLARPLLEKLVEDTRETVHLAILDNFEVVYIDKVDGHQPVKMASRVGNRMPAHSTGLGKALLAYNNESQWPVYVNKKGLISYTPNTITNPEEFYTHLQGVKQRGYAIDNSENEDGIRCVAVPIHDHTGNTIGAISVSGWSLTMTPERDEGLAMRAKDTARQISERLGSDRDARDN